MEVKKKIRDAKEKLQQKNNELDGLRRIIKYTDQKELEF